MTGPLLGTNLRLHTREAIPTLLSHFLFLYIPVAREKPLAFSSFTLLSLFPLPSCSCFQLALRHCADLLSSLQNTPYPSGSPGASPYNSSSSLAQAGWLASSELWEIHQQNRAKALGIAEAAETEREEGDGKSWPLAVLYGFQGMDGESVLSSLPALTHS